MIQQNRFLHEPSNRSLVELTRTRTPSALVLIAGLADVNSVKNKTEKRPYRFWSRLFWNPATKFNPNRNHPRVLNLSSKPTLFWLCRHFYFLAFPFCLISRYGMDKARKVFHLMIKKGCAPDISSYNIMINGDREARRIEETMELFHEIFQKGPIADTLTYNTLTQGMCQIGRVSSARELLRKMLAFGQVPNVVTCLNLLNGLCKSDKLKEALELFRAMRNGKLELNIVCYNILIGGLCKSRHIEVGKELFHKISVYGLKPDVYTYAIIINGFCKEGLPDEVY
ncbi:hypothetical protein ES319_A10G140300v1 [Gossypium barbadense]|uniref:Pentacotripeptide-repeat region of PRORP domain-containing protein n=1 Tax=Gossypium barbadense TaxID=3634 RepID=A0A5J5U6P3_GOSBA|nr:hypothetical protein ES319_A10G140300v1 [Gossypium barbadense]